VSRLMNRDGRTSVGFLRMTRFDGSGAGLAAIDTAMRRLQGAEAVIIDLRASPGGDADAVKVLSSYFFAEPTHLVTSVGPRDASGQREQFERWTAPNALSSSFASVPLYLLIDGKTFSAAESFAFGLERLGRAQLIGAATGGGGFMNAPFTLAAGFGASISVGRTFDPRTGTGWQSTGVAPTVAVEPDHALNTALNIIAGRASANAGLDARAQGVYSAVQNYANAWYLGDGEEMLRLLDAMYTGLEVDEQTPGVRFDAAARVGHTIDGAGFRTPRELRNREIAVLDVFGDVASSRLMLRETVHEVQLRWVNGTWRITSELISPKPRHGRGH
jgi:hypothetical protein